MPDIDKLVDEINAINQQTNRKIIIILILIIILLGIGGYLGWRHYSNKLGDQISLNEAVTAKLEITEDKFGREVAKRQSYSSLNTKEFLKMTGLDSLSKELQSLVKENKALIKKGGNATLVTTSSELDKNTITNITYVNNDSFPTYDTRFFDDWLSYTIIAKKDTISLDFSLLNKFSVVVGNEPQGLFKKPKSYVTITNHNPYTKTTDIRTYNVKVPKPKRLGFGVNAGYGLHIGSAGISHGLNISVGINYNLIEIK